MSLGCSSPQRLGKGTWTASRAGAAGLLRDFGNTAKILVPSRSLWPRTGALKMERGNQVPTTPRPRMRRREDAQETRAALPLSRKRQPEPEVKCGGGPFLSRSSPWVASWAAVFGARVMAGGEAAPAAGPGSTADGGAGKAREEAGDARLGWVEALRGDCEPEHHWRYRREFLLRNAEALARPPGEEDGGDQAEVRRLVSFSMVWANHVFLGCRYPQQVMEKVLDMAAGITVTNAPTHTLRDELVAKVKRGISSSNEGLEEPCKKRAVGTDKASEDSRSDAKPTKAEVPMETGTESMKNVEKESAKDPEKPLSSTVAQKAVSTAVPAMAQKAASTVPPAVAQKVVSVAAPAMAQKAESAAAVAQKAAPAPAVAQKAAPAPAVAQKAAPAPAVAQKAAPAPAVTQKMVSAAAPTVVQKAASVTPSAGIKVESRLPNYESTAVTRHKSLLASSVSGSESKINYCLTKSSESKSENVLPSEKKDSLESATVLASKSSLQVTAVPAKMPLKLLTSEDAKERQPFFNRLYKAVAWKLVAVGGFSPTVNHVELLNSSIQSVKATLDVDFVPLKELTDLPQNKSSQESVVCELRCKSVYLGTGCGKSKENAKAVASREALKLFLKKKVIVKLCKRKYKGKEVEDLVLLDEESKPLNLPPALKNPQEIL
ncbi:CDKN2A-interacting protein [Paroedura picta]|uniref:CDKN2A-interacting protein n=1 Tax=Paroedura picta TaxID=143630 RepID=UPI004055AED0